MKDLEKMNLKLHSLVIFHHLLEDKVLKLLPAMLSCSEENLIEQVKSYTAFAAQLFKEDENLTTYLWDRIVSDENVYVLKRIRQETISPNLEACLKNELKLLEEISQLSGEEVRKNLHYEGYMPAWCNLQMDFVSNYMDRMEHIDTLGYGMFAKHPMFAIRNQAITPVKSPDPIRLSDLKGYQRERKAVIDNTLALLKGRPAANVLLYGDAGTGKSSTVKALVNEFKDQGLRLIEVTKNQLPDISMIVETLSQNPLKFILYIDDLSFAQDNEEIGVLKAILEGSSSAKTPNIVIYATSNRRHLVKEKFSERGDDDIHRNETIQEQISLSERFGLSVNFFKPNKEEYLEIVHQLAKQHGLEISKEELDLEAERHALQRGGRSPRTASQFVAYLRAKGTF